MRRFRFVSVISRLKALLNVVELFDRASAASLGKTTSGATWDTIRGAWGIDTSQRAVTSTSASAYPLSTLTFSSEDVTISVGGVGPGVGTAFWVTDSNNWWGTYVDGVQVCQTCSTLGNASAWSFAYAAGGNAASYNTVPGNCTTWSTLTPCSTYSTVTNPPSYPCNAYGTVTNRPCNAYGTSTSPGSCRSWSTATSPGSCRSWSTSTTPGGCTAFNSPSLFFVVNFSCGGPGNSAPASSCGLTFAQAQACGGCKRNSVASYNPSSCRSWSSPSTNYPCNAFNAPTTNYPCNAFNAPTTNYPCNAYSTVTNFPCNAYSTVPGSTNYPCNAYVTNRPCNAFNSANFPIGTYNTVNYNVVTNAYNPTTYFSCNCVVENKVKLIKMVAGVISDVATFSFAGTIASFKAILSGSSVTVQAFTGSSYTSQIGSNQSHTISGGLTKTKKHGILKGVVTYSPAETSTIDEFRVV